MRLLDKWKRPRKDRNSFSGALVICMEILLSVGTRVSGVLQSVKAVGETVFPVFLLNVHQETACGVE